MALQSFFHKIKCVGFQLYHFTMQNEFSQISALQSSQNDCRAHFEITYTHTHTHTHLSQNELYSHFKITVGLKFESIYAGLWSGRAEIWGAWWVYVESRLVQSEVVELKSEALDFVELMFWSGRAEIWGAWNLRHLILWSWYFEILRFTLWNGTWDAWFHTVKWLFVSHCEMTLWFTLWNDNTADVCDTWLYIVKWE